MPVRSVYTFVLCALSAHLVNGCMPVSNSGEGVIPIPTTALTTAQTTVTVPTTAPTTTSTTTAPRCPMMKNLILFYEQDDIELSPEYGGAVDPVSTCTMCTVPGQARYFASASTPVPHSNLPEEAVGYMSGMTCPNFCICDWSGECFRPNNDGVSVVFWPYCTGGTCGMYVQVLSDSSQDFGLASTTTSTIFTEGAQTDPDTFGPKPVTDSSYFSAKSIGCTNCSPTTCNG